MNAKDIITWVESQVVDISNEQNIINFVSDLQNKIGELNFNLPDGTKAIGYAGSTNSIEGTGIYKTRFFCKCWGRRKQRSFGKNQMRTAF